MGQVLNAAEQLGESLVGPVREPGKVSLGPAIEARSNVRTMLADMLNVLPSYGAPAQKVTCATSTTFTQSMRNTGNI